MTNTESHTVLIPTNTIECGTAVLETSNEVCDSVLGSCNCETRCARGWGP